MDPRMTLDNIILIGGMETGKSSLISRFCRNEFNDAYFRNIGISPNFKTLIIENIPIKLSIWDTPGNPRFQTVSEAYYKNNDTAVVVFDLTNRESVTDARDALERLKNYSIPIILVGNKSDLDKQVSQSDIDALKNTNENIQHYFEASAKTGENVDAIFSAAARLKWESLAASQTLDTFHQNQAVRKSSFFARHIKRILLGAILVGGIVAIGVLTAGVVYIVAGPAIAGGALIGGIAGAARGRFLDSAIPSRAWDQVMRDVVHDEIAMPSRKNTDTISRNSQTDMRSKLSTSLGNPLPPAASTNTLKTSTSSEQNTVDAQKTARTESKDQDPPRRSPTSSP